MPDCGSLPLQKDLVICCNDDLLSGEHGGSSQYLPLSFNQCRGGKMLNVSCEIAVIIFDNYQKEQKIAENCLKNIVKMI